MTLDRQIPVQFDHHSQAPAWRARTVAALKTLHTYATVRAAGGDPETAPADLLAWCRAGAVLLNRRRPATVGSRPAGRKRF
ncbi:hypothetical protein [Polymorphospora lycopeni]|uniref:Uncharacterized protein n=1 Tax=Polymorphospora lycopeni TaxID=3140240 RepID=A0ABV5CMY2_9ACTN